MVCWYETLLLYTVSLLVPTQAVDPSLEACKAFYITEKACECVVYQSLGLSEGEFKSPNYPKPYRRGLNCILYTFIGDVNEIVRIKFLDMDLKTPVHITPTQTECRDRLRIFKNLERAEVNEEVQHQTELCGNLSNLDRLEFYSSGRALIMEFHTDSESSETHSGFRGVYTFLEKSAFKTDGIRQYGTQCSYDISAEKNKRGNFFSPRYPQEYPRSSNCSYKFMGIKNEIVSVNFRMISLPKHYSKFGCEGSGDVVKVYDGSDSSSKLLNSFCDTHNHIQINSSGPYMYIEFLSDRHHEKQGFTAEYQFWDKNVINTPGPENRQGTDPFAQRSEGRKSETEILQCNESIRSTNSNKSGVILSPMYPGPYSPAIICQYEFQADLNERVQLKFLEMDLHPSHADPKTSFGCLSHDRIKVSVYIGQSKKEIGEWCGKLRSPIQLMSVGPKMKLEFISESTDKTQNSRFKIEYSFRTDFGVLGNGVQDDRKVCIFTFHSTLHDQGFFTSPNFGGIYPRDTECHYLFIGRENENVHISFTQFEVDGIIPRCEKQTDSDVVAFSNFINNEDRKLLPYCGNRPSYPPVTSDAAFFRVTFKSNDKYDATGFKANYRFEKTATTITPGATADPQMSSFGSRLVADVTVSMTTIIILYVTVIEFFIYV